MAVYTSKSALIAAIKQRAGQAVQEAMEQTIEDARDNLADAYGGGIGEYYMRTGTMGSSAMGWMTDETSGLVMLNDEYSYLRKQGIPTTEIFHRAEGGGLAMSGGFWANTVRQAEQNLHKAMDGAF